MKQERAIYWPYILAFVSFWSYGLLASVHLTSPVPALALSLLLAAMTASFAILPQLLPTACRSLTSETWRMNRSDTLAFVMYLGLLSALAGEDLLTCLYGDQLFHAQYSQVLAQKFFRLLALKRGLFLDWVYRDLIWIADGAMLLGGAIALASLARLQTWTRFLVVFFLFLGLRFGVNLFGGNPDTHPSFRLFPPWLSATLLSSWDLAFRLPQFVALAALCSYLFRRMRDRFGTPLSFLFGLAAGTLPVTLHVATLLEPSIWSSAVWTAVLFTIPQAFSEHDPTARGKLWFRMSTLLAVGTMMRQPTFVGFIPLFAALAWRERKNTIQLWPVLLPCLVMLPQTVGALVFKTPAIQGVSARGMLPGFVSALGNGTVLQIALTSLFGYGVALLPFAFVPLARASSGWALAGIRSLWFGLGVAIFFSINPELWGTGRYQAEYLAPFAVFGVCQSLSLLREHLKGSLRQLLPAGLAMLLIGVNSSYYLSLPTLNPTVDERKHLTIRSSRILSQFNYEFAKAYEFIQASGLAGKTYYAGLGYGNFTAIIHGYSVRDWIAEFDLLNTVEQRKAERGVSRLGWLHASDILEVPAIQAVILGDALETEGQAQFVATLEKAGFSPIGEFKNEKYGSTLTVLAIKK